MTKTKTPPLSSYNDPVTEYARAVERGEIVAGPHVRDAAKRHLDDLMTGHERGLVFDADEAERFFRFCRTVLRLSEGQFDGRPFELHISQKFICGSLFGWKWERSGKRRFRRAYIEQGKGNGKSPMVGAIGLYGMVSDGEAWCLMARLARKSTRLARRRNKRASCFAMPSRWWINRRL